MRCRIVRKQYQALAAPAPVPNDGVSSRDFPELVQPGTNPIEVKVIFLSPALPDRVTMQDLKSWRDTDMGFDLERELSILPANLRASFELEVEEGAETWRPIGYYNGYHLAKEPGRDSST